ncbi:MAG: ABC transporter permease [Cellulomonadaceae bacterium]|jgi:peptide/nickel transport system permease protein|nr:ABC transporter permease [Cellulomonadaceae bacterium]
MSNELNTVTIDTEKDTEAVVDNAQLGENVENAIELKEVEGLSQGTIVMRRFLRHRGAMVSAAVLILLVLLVATSIGWGPIPGWWQFGIRDISPIARTGGAPTMGFYDGGFHIGTHPFGQDNIGRDVFALVMRGAQQSLTVMVVIGILATVIGVLLGALSGFFGKWVDNVIMRFTDMIITVPVIMVGAILGVLVGGANPWTLAIALSFVTWTSMARLVRAQFLALRELEFVDAARVAGASNARIMFKHILPNAVGVIIVNATLLMASAILLETALSFLGFGINHPEVSLGQLINEYQTAFATRPWLFWWPGVFIVTIALCVNFIGDGLRDAFDPRQRRIPTKRALLKAEAKRTAKAAKALANSAKTGAIPAVSAPAAAAQGSTGA